MKHSRLYFWGGVGALALSMIIFYFSDPKQLLKAEAFLAISGTIIGSLSFVAGCYFALLAVTAFGHIQKVESSAAKVESFSVNASETAESMKRTAHHAVRTASALSRYADDLSEILTDDLHDAVVNGPAGAREILYQRLKLAREKYRFRSVQDDDSRLAATRVIISLGETQDLRELEEFLGQASGLDAAQLRLVVQKRLGELERDG